MARKSLVWFLIIPLLAGCAAPLTGIQATIEGSSTSRAQIIALLDTGTFPYLPIFGTTQAYALDPAEVPITEVVLNLTGSGTMWDREESDEAIWNGLAERHLYHFAGTRILAISFGSFDAPTGIGIHGAKTSYLAAREAPNAWIVAVQVEARDCRDRPFECLVNPSVAEGMEWIADQDWIDVVSISINLPGHAPDSAQAHPEFARFVAASERAASAGKIIVNSAGNDPTPVLGEYFSGPPWIVTVGGAEPKERGVSLVSGKPADVVANMTEQVPKVLSDELEDSIGTSFATPIVAGTLAHALHLVRQAEPERVVTTQEWRDALNASAVQWSDPASWDPVPSCRGPFVFGCAYTATAPVLAQPQMGWGYVDAGLAPEIARRVLEGDLAPPAEKQEAALFQAQWQKAREEYWARWPRG